MKKFTEWQFARVRDALRAFHRYERGIDGEYFTWKDVREAIIEYTGVEIGDNAKYGAERLRVFVDGVEDKNAPGGRKYSAPIATSLKAIIAFLTHEDLNLLTEDELQEFEPDSQAPIRLTEFLHKDCGFLTNPDLASILGQFMADHPGKNGWTTRTLYLDRPSKDGVAKVVETHHHYATENAEEALKWYKESNRENLLSYVNYSGWAIVTPEESLMLFLKRESSGKNHRYTCLDESCLSRKKRHWPFKVVAEDHILDPYKSEGMIMLLHDYGHNFRKAKDKKHIMDVLERDLFVFQKLFGAPV